MTDAEILADLESAIASIVSTSGPAPNTVVMSPESLDAIDRIIASSTGEWWERVNELTDKFERMGYHRPELTAGAIISHYEDMCGRSIVSVDVACEASE